MRYAHAVSDVRDAERALMARVPDGALMQRAAAGLAVGLRQPARAGSTARGWWCSPVPATTAATPCTPRRGWPPAAPASPPSRPGQACTRQAAAALRRAGGRLAGATEPSAAAAIAAADLIIDGILGIGGRGGLREPAATLAGLVAERGGCGISCRGDGPAERRRCRHRRGRGRSDQGRRDRDVRDPEARAARRPRRELLGDSSPRRHRTWPAPDRRARGRRPAGGRRRRAPAAAWCGVRQVPARRARRPGGQPAVHGSGGAQRRRRDPRRRWHGQAGLGQGRGRRRQAALARGGHHGDRSR